MVKVKTLDGLRIMREELQSKAALHSKNKETEDLVRIKVAMATCSIASGSQDTINYFVNELDKRNISASISQTGCMGYCYAEPTIEVTLPGSDPIVFGYVDEKKADEIIEKYIRNGELVESVIPVNYQNIDDTAK